MVEIEVWLACDLAHHAMVETIEVEDDATEEQIEEEAREWALQHVEWGWRRVAPSHTGEGEGGA